jgi:hypothetical protein
METQLKMLAGPKPDLLYTRWKGEDVLVGVFGKRFLLFEANSVPTVAIQHNPRGLS